MTKHGARTRRISWKVRRSASGWEPIVLIGETPVAFPAMADKGAARHAARAHAKTFVSTPPA